MIRLASIAVGAATAVVLWQLALACRAAPESVALPAFSRGEVVVLPISRNPSCPRFPGGMRVTSVAIRELFEPFVRQETRAGDAAIRAEYSGSWAEYKYVTAAAADAGSVRLEAAYETDYGDFDGIVDDERSSVHDHDGMLCFDLIVVRGDRSGIEERWQGELRLR